MTGETISHYRIIEKLGEGGMGIVYKARDTKLNRIVALKFLHPGAISDRTKKTRLLQEAQAAAAVNHPNICTVYEINEFEEQVFIAMEYIEGRNLKEIIHPPLSSLIKEGFREALDIAMHIAEGLQEIHSKGMVHRDIKSDNIRITNKGRIKIMDFGLVKSLQIKDKLSEKDSTSGTIAYMSPEQIRGEEVDNRSDIWSWGVVLYEMLAGRWPFKTDKRGMAVVYSILDEQPESLQYVNADIPKKLEDIVNKALAKDPGERYQSMQDVLVDLQAVKKTDQEKSQPEQMPVRYNKKSMIKYFIIGFIVVIATLAGIYVTKQIKKDTPIESIAVLPLKDISGGSEKDWFADQMTDILITELSKIEALRVISHTSIMRFKNIEKSLPQIADMLHVDALVEGSVARIEDRIRINVQLIDGRTDEHLWAEDYESEFKDVLSLQKKIACRIAGAIKVKITPEDLERIGTAREVDPEAFKHYLAGINYHRKFDILKAIEYYQKSIALDSTFGQAWANLADVTASQALWGNQPGAREIWAPISRQAIKKAKKLCVDKAEFHYFYSKAHVEAYLNWNWEEAGNAYQRAIELNPGVDYIYSAYGYYYLSLGKFDKALYYLEKAFELNPFYTLTGQGIALVYHVMGSLDTAIYYYENFAGRKLDFESKFEDIEYAYWQKSDNKKELLENWVKVWENKEEDEITIQILGGQSRAYALLGRREDALRTMKRLEERYSPMSWIPAAYAEIYACLGEKERAMDFLEKMYQDSCGWLVVMHRTRAHSPLYDIMYPEPEFRELLKKVGLEE